MGKFRGTAAASIKGTPGLLACVPRREGQRDARPGLA